MRRSSSSSSSGFESTCIRRRAAGLVHEVDRLVRQETVGDIAVRELGRRHERRIGDPHAVMKLVFLLDAAQDRDRILDRRLGHEHRLEAAGQRCVFLDMLAIFIERGGADAMQFAARQRRLEQVRRIHRAIGLAGADERVHFVDEQDDAARRPLDFGQHRLQPLFEFAAVFGAGDERAHVERHELLVLEAFRHVAIDDAQRQTFGDGRLADARLADQHRIVLGAPRQHLDGAADFLVAADDRVELAAARRFGEIAGIFFERIIALLGGRRVGGAPLAQRVDGL